LVRRQRSCFYNGFPTTMTDAKQQHCGPTHRLCAAVYNGYSVAAYVMFSNQTMKVDLVTGRNFCITGAAAATAPAPSAGDRPRTSGTINERVTTATVERLYVASVDSQSCRPCGLSSSSLTVL